MNRYAGLTRPVSPPDAMPPGPRLAFVTCAEYPDLIDDDRLLRCAVEARGARVVPVRWDEGAVPWGTFDLVVMRSPWDYFKHRWAFIAWLDRLDQTGVPVANPLAVLRWNLDKRYLRQLAADGCPVVPTLWVESPEALATLPDDVARLGWSQVVVKPAVSGGAWRSALLPAADAHALRDGAASALETGAALVQPFLTTVAEDGEWSVVYLGGAFAHAVRKRAAPGEWRVQSDHGGTTAAETPPDVVREGADRALAAATARLRVGPLPYARIDGVVADGVFVLMEAELLEPELFFRHGRDSADRLAALLLASLAAAGRVTP